MFGYVDRSRYGAFGRRSLIVGGGVVLAFSAWEAWAQPKPAPRFSQPGRMRGTAADVADNGWCDDQSPGPVNGRTQLLARNRIRLEAAAGELAPGGGVARAGSEIGFVADYQREMRRVQPDRAAAAGYLAHASTVSITMALLGRVNSLLCVATSRPLAEAIVVAAEKQRRKLVH